MSSRAWFIIALPWLLAANGPAAEPAAAAESPQWWLRRAFIELTHYQDQRGRRTRQTQLELLGNLGDLQEAIGDRAGRIETCRFAAALMYMRREPLDVEGAFLQTSPAPQAARYAAVIGLRPPGPQRDEARAWAAGLLADKGDLKGAMRIAAAIDHPVERNASVGRLITELLRAGRTDEALQAADCLAVVPPESAGWGDLLAVYCRLAPAQAQAGRAEAAQRSLDLLSEGMGWQEATVPLRMSIMAARGQTLAILNPASDGAAWLSELADVVRREDLESLPVQMVCEALATGADHETAGRLINHFPERLRLGLWMGLAETLMGAGEFEEGERALGMVPPGEVQPVYVRLGRRMLEAGEVGGAVRLAGRARDRACGVDSYEAGPCLYEQILIRDDLTVTMAQEIADTVLQNLPDRARATTVKRLIVAAKAIHRTGATGQAPEVLRGALKILSESERRYLLDDVIRAMLAIGMVDEAAPLALAEAPAEVVGVARAYAEAGRPEDAARIVREVLGAAEARSDEGIIPAIGAMDLALAASYTRDRGLQDIALRLASTELLSTNVGRWSTNTESWRSLARAYRVAGRLADLAAVVDQVRRPSTRVSVNIAVAEELLGR